MSYEEFKQELLEAIRNETQGISWANVQELQHRIHDRIHGSWSHRATEDLQGQGLIEARQFSGQTPDQTFVRIRPSDVSSSGLNEAIPASDRIVSLSDNQPESDEIKSSLSALSQQLADANDFESMTEWEIIEARREVYLLQQSFDAERVRVDWIAPLAKKCLAWIADKAAGAAVGEAAKAALSAVLRWLAAL